MTVKELLSRISYRIISGSDEAEAYGVSFDNRKVSEGDVFVCIRGVYFDTHSVIREIAEKKPSVIVTDSKWADEVSQGDIEWLRENGANVISVEDTRVAKAYISAAWNGYPSEKMTVIGITGSKGKTTTAHMVWSMLLAAGVKAGMVGTTGGHIGDEDIHFGTTTPDSDQMQMFLRKMADSGCTHAVVEASSQGLKLHRTDCIDFDYGIFLNIEKGDHVSPTEHKSFEEYLDCKRMLLRSSKVCIVNGDDPHIDEMLEGVTGKVIRYGYGEDNGYVISDVKEGTSDGLPYVSFRLNDSDEIKIGMPGTFNVGNAASACTALMQMDLLSDAAKEALTDIKVPGRLDMVYRSDRISVCVDYAHNGLSTRNLLKALRSYGPKRIVCVFGCGGNRDVDRRPEMGEAAGELADLSIITTEHNRFEEFEDILKGIMAGMKKTSGRYEIIEDRKEAIRHAIMDSEPGDLITILGIGNDGYQHDHGKDIPHDDISFSRQVVEELLNS